MLLLLCLLVAPLHGVKLKSSGTHLLVLRDNSVHWNALRLSGSSFRSRRDADGGGSSPVEVRQFHVSSVLYSRFATVTIDSEVLNAAQDASREIAFRVQVPETAFMSNFSMVVDGRTYLAQVFFLF